MADKQGMRPQIVQRPGKEVEAISTARAVFPRSQFDEVGCSLGLRRLRAYRKDWDDLRGVWKDRPRHDEASHGADAFLTFACSNVPEQRVNWDKLMKRRPVLGIV